MLKLRVMPTLLYKDTTLVKGVGFNSWRRVGSLMQAVKVYNMRQVDELVFLDITATAQGRSPDFELVDDFADECFMPLSVGGGIKDVSDVRKLLAVGADKIVTNTKAFYNPEFISEVANKFGSQCVVVSIDYRKNPDGRNIVYTHSGNRKTDMDVIEYARIVESKGAGEIILTSIDRDGRMEGYDIELLSEITGMLHIPVIASGGAGNYSDMLDAFQKGHASAVAAASIFHFTEQTPIEAKKFLHDSGLPVRL